MVSGIIFVGFVSLGQQTLYRGFWVVGGYISPRGWYSSSNQTQPYSDRYIALEHLCSLEVKVEVGRRKHPVEVSRRFSCQTRGKVSQGSVPSWPLANILKDKRGEYCMKHGDTTHLALTALKSPVGFPMTSCCNDKWTSPHSTKINTETREAASPSRSKYRLTSGFLFGSPL